MPTFSLLEAKSCSPDRTNGARARQVKYCKFWRLVEAGGKMDVDIEVRSLLDGLI